jgi:uroporphyrinogen decarboxylase
MTPREIVLASLRFEGPPRIPYGMGGGFPSDLAWVGHGQPPNSRARDWVQCEGYWDMVDMWGNEWRRLEGITKGEPYLGVFQRSWDAMESYDWPDLDRAELFEGAAARAAECHERGLFVLGGMGWPFDTSRYLRGMQHFLMDCALEPERIEHLLERVGDLYERVIHRYADAGVDAVMTCEDWGTQDRLLVSPAMHRELFLPYFRRLCGAAHERGLSVWIHSCGYVRDVIGDWIEAGVDVCQFDQPELHGIGFLAEHFGGRAHFWCPVDIQTTLQTADPARIEAAAREYVEKLGCYGGGFIAGYYGSNEAIGVDPDTQAIACRAFMRYGDPAPPRREA